jgi:uncharacterized membrane protein
MTILVIGIALFFGVHIIPASPLRAALANRLGEGPYKGLFSLGALAGFGLIIYGFSIAEFVPVWSPLPFARELSFWVMPVAIILLTAANVPSNIKRFVRHPMLIGLALWGATHLAANGDLASTLVFASFLTYSIFNIAAVELAGRHKVQEAVSPAFDIAIIIGGLLLAAALYYFHGFYTGMPLR